MKKKKKRIRIKWKNIFKLLLFIVSVVFIFNMSRSIIFNNKVYKNIDGDKLTINIKKKYLKLNSKNIEYIKESKVKVKINYKGKKYILNNDSLTKKTNIVLNTYNKKITKAGFNNSKGYFIDITDNVESGKVDLLLPKYLYKNKVVDIYAVRDNKYTLVSSKANVDDEKISFDVDNRYDKYVITYVKLKKINIDDIKLKKNNKVKLSVEYEPKKATNKDIKYDKVDNKYIEIKDDSLLAKEEGTTTFNIVNEKDDVKTEVTVNITDKKYVVTKKNGLYYVDGIVLVNKSYPIPKNYDPGKLNSKALDAFYKMQSAALIDGANLWITSGYRSYDTQKKLYESYVKDVGKTKADTFSARAGYSEHQTGYAMDLNIVDSSFEGTKEAIWLEKNCYKYGFIIRYPKEKQKITGYKYEPWHVRYIGVKKAKKIYESGLTLEEFYGLNSSYESN